MFRFEQQKFSRGLCKKKAGRKLPRLTINDVCECQTSVSPEQFCAKGQRGCKLTTKTIRPVPFPVAPLTTFEDLTQKQEGECKEFIDKVKRRAQSVLMEKPKDTQIKMLSDKLYGINTAKSTQCLYQNKKTRPSRILCNREIMNKIMRRKALRDRKCGERLGPYQQVDPLTVAQDLFLFCKADRFKNCIQKKKHAAEEEMTRKKELKDLAVQTDESYIMDMKNQLVTKEALEEAEMNKLREAQNKKAEKKRLRKLKREASVTVLDWEVKPNPCKTLLNEDGECPEKDVNDSSEDSEDDKIECTCKHFFKYCMAHDFLRRRDYRHNWMPNMKCASATPMNKEEENQEG